MELFIITGEPNSKKSSVIRALTGVRDSKKFDITFKDGIKEVWIEIVSPNEINNNANPRGLKPNEFIDYIIKKKVNTVIFPIRNKYSLYEMPNADKYIEVLYEKGFKINKVVMFNEKVEVPIGIETELIYNTKDTTANELANSIRNIWRII